MTLTGMSPSLLPSCAQSPVPSKGFLIIDPELLADFIVLLAKRKLKGLAEQVRVVPRASFKMLAFCC